MNNKIPLRMMRGFKFGCLSYPSILKELEAALRGRSILRANYVEKRNAIQNKLIHWTGRYFPEFMQALPSF
ncbi:hypothetical protein CN582_28850 [Bacillus wiedmannii]|nr:hypothetical protein CN582_28850 [Bacillus wiedmannii]